MMKKKAKLFIFDKYDNLLSVTTKYKSAIFEETVEKPVQLVITYPMNDEDVKHLVGGNQVAFYDLKGNLRLFTLREIDDIHDNDIYKVIVGLPAIQELSDVYIEERVPQDKPAEFVLDIILENSRWKRGHVDDFGLGSTSFFFDDAYSSLSEKQIKTYGGEIVDRIEIDKNKITGRYIDHIYRKGRDTGKRWEIGKDVKSIKRTYLYYPKTALYGKGSSLEIEDEETGEKTGGYSRKITFRDIEWSKEKGDPVDKPKGQEWVGDDEARLKHGIYDPETGEMHHRFGMFEDSDEEDTEELLKKTWQAVQDEKEPLVQYEMGIKTFYNVAGYEHEQVFLGDSGILRDKEVKPMILVQSRIMSWKYDIGNPEDAEIVLGNVLELTPKSDDIDWVIGKVKDNFKKWEKDEVITDKKFPDIKPPIPENVDAEGLFKTIIVSWDYVSKSYISAYEVFASKVKGFVPDETNLVFRGKTGGYTHNAKTNEKWYFRVRAVNTHGTASDYSEEVSASTVSVNFNDIDEENIPEFIEHAIYKGNTPPDYQDYKYWLDTTKKPYILKYWDSNDLEWISLSPTSPMDIGAVDILDYQNDFNRLTKDIEGKADADSVYTVEELDNKFKNVVSISQYETDKDGIVRDLHTQKSEIEQNAKKIAEKVSSSTYVADKEGMLNSINDNKLLIEKTAESVNARIQSTNIRIDKMDIRGANFITHMPENWEYGFYHIDDGEKHDSTHLIRLKDKYRLESNQDYVLSDHPDHSRNPDEYPKVNIFLFLWNRDGSFSRYIVLNFRNEEHYVTFKTSENENMFSLHVMPTNTDEPLNPKMIHETFYFKLSLGTEKSGWTPHLDDTAHLVSKVQNYVTEFDYKAESILAKVQGLEKTANSMNEEIASIKVETNRIEQRVENTQIGERNLILKGDIPVSSSKYLVNIYYMSEDWETNTTYTALIKGRVNSGQKFGIWANGSSTRVAIAEYDEKLGLYKATFKTPSSINTTVPKTFRVYNYPSTGATNASIEWVKLVKGNTTSIDFQKAPEDFEGDIKQNKNRIQQAESNIEQQAKQITQKVSYNEYNYDLDKLTNRVDSAESTIEQHADEIIKKVSRNGVISSINQTPETVKISASKVAIDGDLYVTNGKVYIKDGIITNSMIAGDAKIDGAKIANASISSAKIISLSANKIKTGELDAEKVLIRVKNGLQSVQMDSTGFVTKDSKGIIRIHIGIRNLAGKGQSNPSTIRFFTKDGKKSVGVGMNVDDVFVVGTSASGVQTEYRSGEYAIHYAKQHRFVMRDAPNYWMMTRFISSGTEHPTLRPNNSGRGYLGTSKNRLWRIYVNHLHYYQQHKLSKREYKENIRDLDLGFASDIFNKITLRRFHYKRDGLEATDLTESFGVILDESPKEIISQDGEAIIQDNFVGIIAGALKYEQQRNDELENRIQELEKVVFSNE